MRFLILLALIGLSACASQKFGNDGSVSKVSDLATVASAENVAAFESGRPFRFGPLDKLSYQVLGLDDFKGEVQVDTSGRISVPLAGSIKAEGMTSAEIADHIAGALKAGGIRNPTVSVNAVEINSQTVTVSGSVEQPGVYPIQRDMTLQRAVALAKGLTQTGSDDNIVIFREVDGKRYAALYNLKAIRRGAYKDPQIFANDIVAVDESSSKKLFRNIAQIGPGILAPLVILATR